AAGKPALFAPAPPRAPPASFPPMNSIPSLDRRAMLKWVALAGAASASPVRLFGQRASGAPAARVITDYLETLARPDQGYAWGDQEISHLTPTFGVIGAYRVLGQ